MRVTADILFESFIITKYLPLYLFGQQLPAESVRGCCDSDIPFYFLKKPECLFGGGRLLRNSSVSSSAALSISFPLSLRILPFELWLFASTSAETSSISAMLTEFRDFF